MDAGSNENTKGRVDVYRIMPSKFSLVKVAELPFMSDKIECHGIKNNWKIFFRTYEGNKTRLRAFTFRVKTPLIPPELTEDNVEFYYGVSV